MWGEHGIGDKVSFAEFEQEMEADQSHIPLLPSADFAIRQLSENFHIILITSRNRAWEAATRGWFKNFLGVQDIELYFTGHRKETDYQPKGVLCKNLGISLLVDDNLGHCQSAVEQGVDAILFGNYGWHVDVPETIIRGKDWPAVLEYINGTYYSR